MATQIRFDKIVTDTYVDGPGRRVALFLQGCTLGCPGCQNKHLWPMVGGQLLTVHELAALMAIEAGHHNYTITGGEPFQQAYATAFLIRNIRQLDLEAHIIVYTGYTYEELLNNPDPAVANILAQIDVLVDGRYDHTQDSATMQYRGSANQRPIDMRATRETGELVVLDWDKPEVIITHDGRVLGNAPIIQLLQGNGLGDGSPSRRCGQTR